MTKVHGHRQRGADVLVIGHLVALVPGQRSTQVRRQVAHCHHRVAYAFGAAPGRRGGQDNESRIDIMSLIGVNQCRVHRQRLHALGAMPTTPPARFGYRRGDPSADDDWSVAAGDRSLQRTVQSSLRFGGFAPVRLPSDAGIKRHCDESSRVALAFGASLGPTLGHHSALPSAAVEHAHVTHQSSTLPISRQ